MKKTKVQLEYGTFMANARTQVYVHALTHFTRAELLKLTNLILSITL